ncbi:MAG: hypothetical protein ACK4GL_12535 [Flavobacteriales bacterium]
MTLRLIFIFDFKYVKKETCRRIDRENEIFFASKTKDILPTIVMFSAFALPFSEEESNQVKGMKAVNIKI